MEITPAPQSWQSFYKLMIGSIVPRPIAWVSTLSADGRKNLAPFSFFTAGGANPPHVVFSPMIRTRDGSPKDTLRNIRETGEFVVNIVTESLAEAMNLTAGEYDSSVDEFELAKLTAVPSVTVKPFRVGESPIHYECTLAHLIDLGSEPGAGSVVIGRVTHLHVADELLIGEDKIDIEKLHAIGRLAGSAYTRVNDFFNLERPKV